MNWVKKELTIKGVVKLGDRGDDAKKVQEWLCLHGYSLDFDGVFGKVTWHTVCKFQQENGIDATGDFDETLFHILSRPMYHAVTRRFGYGDFPSTILKVANYHYNQRPRELSNANLGPWVRLYMKGSEDLYWCAGFATFICKQAAIDLEMDSVVSYSWRCTDMAYEAQKNGRFISGEQSDIDTKIKPGFLFLSRDGKYKWSHTGVVSRVEKDYFETFEGNGSAAGSRNGNSVTNNRRGFAGRRYDFINTEV